MLKGFKEFILRGNVIDLAVAFVLGVAFSAVIKSMVDNFINPLIAAIFGKPDLSGVGNFTIGKGSFHLGLIINDVLSFLFVAAAIYFVVVAPMNALQKRRAKPEETAEATEVELLTEIRDALQGRPA